ncbi:GmrSD restriction endonuclease domain-containing protein [Plantactinospora sp. CA-294935]|uniref:GmrSD restriction endonuclease domain-containing protein n=1 Tax=Plantactinospora sp. CA-294935 TaxID=3240012 RepID=UPI003D946B0B
MALDSPKLQKVLEEIKIGVIQLPDFQREWKWDDQRIRELIATVTLDYPLGVVMTLETGGSSPFRARPLTGAEDAGSVTPGLLLLDGQQRLTSLFQSLHLARPVRTVDDRNKELRRWYYVDIVKAVGSPADRDDAIVSVPEDRVLRSDFARRVDLDLSSTEMECRAAYFPLSQVFDGDKMTAWQREFVKMDDGNWDLWAQFQQQVLNNIRSFQIPMIRLGASTTKDAVCSVFERVNTGGVPLNVFELLTATYAGDQDYEREQGTHYRLPDVWHDIKKRLATSYPVFGRLEYGLTDGLSSSDFLQAVTLVVTWERKQNRRAAGVACKRRDLLALPLNDFRRVAPQVADAFEWVGEFLNRQCIVRSADLPYRTQLVPLAAVRTILGERTDEPELQERIVRWYWCGVLGEMYGGSTESRFTRDVEQIIAWAQDSGGTPDTITEAAFLSDRLDSLTTRNSAAYKGIYALLIKQGAVDWHHSEAPFTPGTLVQNSVDIHQVFPKSWFARHGGQDRRGNSIVNKTPLSYRTSRSMTGSPSAYLKVLAQESGTRPEWFDDVIATHLIDPATLRHDDFEGFYADRSKRLLELVNEAMGKRTVFRDQSDR